MIRRRGAGSTVFATTIETHGSYSPVSETAVNSNSNISELKVVYDDASYTAVSIEDLEGHRSTFILSNSDAAESTKHELTIEGKAFQWSGPFHYSDSQ